MKKLSLGLLILFCGFMFFSFTTTTVAVDSSAYQQLAPITGPNGEAVDTTSLPSYLNAVYRIGIGICFALGVIMFTWAGIEYIVSESMNTKSDAKKRIAAALTGLAIALVSYILLNTINPDLLKLNNINATTPTTP